MKIRRKIVKVKFGEIVPKAKYLGSKKCIEAVDGKLTSVKYSYFELKDEDVAHG